MITWTKLGLKWGELDIAGAASREKNVFVDCRFSGRLCGSFAVCLLYLVLFLSEFLA